MLWILCASVCGCGRVSCHVHIRLDYNYTTHESCCFLMSLEDNLTTHKRSKKNICNINSIKVG